MSGAAPRSTPSTAGRIWPMYRSMVGVGLSCGLLIVGVFLWTRPAIERNRAEALERAILRVLPEARSSRTFRLAEGDRFEVARGSGTGGAFVYAGYDERGDLVGMALEARGMGYQDVIRVLYGYSVAREEIIGLEVLESRETPGLGDKIETNPAFLENFERLDVALLADGSGLAHPIEFVKPGRKEHPWQVDGITGATISSTAIAKILRADSARWVPLVRRSVDDFRVEE